jgi:hypothetical protein
MAREQFNHEWEDPKKKKPPYKGTPKPKPGNNYNEQHNTSMGGKKDPHKNPEKPKGTEKPNPKKGYPTDDLFKKMGEQKASVKIENIKKKTTESVLKEKMEAKEKLKKKSPTSRARPMLPKTKKKKKK